MPHPRHLEARPKMHSLCVIAEGKPSEELVRRLMAVEVHCELLVSEGEPDPSQVDKLPLWIITTIISDAEGVDVMTRFLARVAGAAPDITVLTTEQVCQRTGWDPDEVIWLDR